MVILVIMCVLCVITPKMKSYTAIILPNALKKQFGFRLEAIEGLYHRCACAVKWSRFMVTGYGVTLSDDVEKL